MSEIVTYKNGPRGCFCQIKLDSGERVLISVAQDGIQIYRLRFAGFLPGEVIWGCPFTPDGFRAVYAHFDGDEHNPRHPLDVMRDAIVRCGSIAEIRKEIGSRKARASRDEAGLPPGCPPLREIADLVDWFLENDPKSARLLRFDRFDAENAYVQSAKREVVKKVRERVAEVAQSPDSASIEGEMTHALATCFHMLKEDVIRENGELIWYGFMAKAVIELRLLGFILKARDKKDYVIPEALRPLLPKLLAALSVMDPEGSEAGIL